MAVPEDWPEGLLRSGLGARLEKAVTGTEGMPEWPPASVYVDDLDLPIVLRRSGLGALLEAAVERAVGVSVERAGVEAPVPGTERESRDPWATWLWTLMDLLCRVSRSLIHWATGNRWTEDRARMSARVS